MVLVGGRGGVQVGGEGMGTECSGELNGQEPFHRKEKKEAHHVRLQRTDRRVGWGFLLMGGRWMKVEGGIFCVCVNLQVGDTDWIHKGMDGWMDGWKDGWMDGWKDGWITDLAGLPWPGEIVPFDLASEK